MTFGFSTSEPIWGDKFINRYLEVGERYSMENESLHTGFMLGLLGQSVGDSAFYVGDNEKHCRIHPFMVQDSGSGKDPAFDYAKKIAMLANIEFSDSNDLTNAGLVGTFSDGEKVPGAAETYDIVGFREAVQLFKSANMDWNENLAENMNAILDGGQVERHMADGTIEYQATCTLVGTSYPPTDTDMKLENLMRNGTLARFLYFFREISSDFRFRIGDKILERAVNESSGGEFTGDEIVETLSVIRDEFCGGKVFTFNYDTEQAKRDVRDIIEGNLVHYESITRTVVEPAVTRYIEHLLRIACLMAALDECSTEVNDKHINQALEFVELSWTQLLEFFQSYHEGSEDSDESPSTREEMLYLLAKDEKKTKLELADELGVHERTIQRCGKQLEALDRVERLKMGKERAYKLT